MATPQTQPFTNPDLPIWREAFAGRDWVRLHMSPTYIGWGVRKGNGEPVVLVPGFLASDASMIELKLWLERMGYRSYYAGFGRNKGCPKDLAQKVCETVGRARKETGQPVTVIGHSLGGSLARAAAISCSEDVKRVVTMGSPVNGARVHPLVVRAGERVRRRTECDATCYIPLMLPLPEGIAETCVYTKTDGIVDWRTCSTSTSDCIEVTGTHIGMVWNPQVYRAIGRVLAGDAAPQAPSPTPRSKLRSRRPSGTRPEHRKGDVAKAA